MADKPVIVEFGASIGPLVDGIQAVNKQLEGLLSPINELKEGLSGFGELIASAFAVEQIAEAGNEVLEFGRKFGEAGEAIERFSQEMGIPVDAVSKLNNEFRLTGLGSDEAKTAFDHFARSISEANNPTSRQAQLFEQLGVTTKNADGSLRNVNDVLRDVANRFAASANDANKTQVAFELFGRSGIEMIPTLNKGADGLDELGRIAQATGANLDELAVTQMVDLNRKIIEMDLHFDALSQTLFLKTDPALEHFVEFLTEVADASKKAVQGVSDFAMGVDGLKRISNDTGIISKMFGIGGASSLLQALNGAGADDGAGAANHRGPRPHPASVAPEEGGNKPSIGYVNPEDLAKEKAAYDKFQEDLRNADEETARHSLAMAQLTTQGDERDLAERLRTHKITIAEWQAEEKKSADKELADQKKGLAELKADLTARGQLTITDARKIHDQLEELELKHKQRLAEIDRAAAQKEKEQLDKERAAWQGFATSISTSLGSALKGLIEGTQTWADTTRGLADEALGAVTNMGERALEALLEDLILGDTATGESNFKRAMSTAASAAAKAYDAVVGIPYVGPFLAPAAAAAAFIAVEGFANMASLDVGTNYVASDGLAKIHRGEAIVPAQVNARFNERKFMGGQQGPTHVHYSPTIHVNAFSQSGVREALDNHGREFLDGLTKALRNNPSFKSEFAR